MVDDQTIIISHDEICQVAQKQRQLLATYKQLVLSLKFHHAASLKKLPQEMALQAMQEVWEACQH